jgi:ubiquinone/menaquinone biosynthesis C-methylase UbiE
MFPAASRSGPAGFDAVDASGDPGALIGFLDAATSVPGLGAAKRSLLDHLALGQARAALDVGCGFGADVAAMADSMPPGAEVWGLDASGTMIAEARRRTADLGPRVSLRVGEATNLPFPDEVFDACLADTVLQHIPDAARAVREMARVTHPGGRVASLEFDLGTTFLDHPDRETTRIILDTFTDAAVQGRIGRQLPRLFRLAGLTDVSITPTVVLSNASFWRILYRDHVARLQDQGLLTSQEVSQWWTTLDRQAQAGHFLGGAVIFLAAATRPGEGPAGPSTAGD